MNLHFKKKNQDIQFIYSAVMKSEKKNICSENCPLREHFYYVFPTDEEEGLRGLDTKSGSGYSVWLISK